MKSDQDISDLFLYGRLNNYAATDSAYQDKQQLYLAEADTIFAQVAAKVPDNYLGNFWRARVNSCLLYTSVPPLPIPNREVKPCHADGTASQWESR